MEWHKYIEQCNKNDKNCLEKERNEGCNKKRKTDKEKPTWRIQEANRKYNRGITVIHRGLCM